MTQYRQWKQQWHYHVTNDVSVGWFVLWEDGVNENDVGIVMTVSTADVFLLFTPGLSTLRQILNTSVRNRGINEICCWVAVMEERDKTDAEFEE